MNLVQAANELGIDLDFRTRDKYVHLPRIAITGMTKSLYVLLNLDMTLGIREVLLTPSSFPMPSTETYDIFD